MGPRRRKLSRHGRQEPSPLVDSLPSLSALPRRVSFLLPSRDTRRQRTLLPSSRPNHLRYPSNGLQTSRHSSSLKRSRLFLDSSTSLLTSSHHHFLRKGFPPNSHQSLRRTPHRRSPTRTSKSSIPNGIFERLERRLSFSSSSTGPIRLGAQEDDRFTCRGQGSSSLCRRSAEDQRDVGDAEGLADRRSVGGERVLSRGESKQSSFFPSFLRFAPGIRSLSLESHILVYYSSFI